jgi:hypothetical protein
MFYTELPTRLTALTDDLSDSLPDNYHFDVIRFCVMRAHEKEKDFRASEKAQEHYNNNIYARRAEAHKLDDSFDSIDPDPYDYL